jgi:hypothetical protein
MDSENTRVVAGLVHPDVDLHAPGQRRELGEHPVAVLGSIAVGGWLDRWPASGSA